jgi:uncharacterized protein YndB with AHSA1/START domain
MSNTVRFHRVLRTTPEKVYRAFLDPDALVKWLPPNGFTGKVHQLDARVGGKYRMSFTNFSTGNSHFFGGEYLELVPNERIRHSDRFDDPNLPGEMQTTITLKKVSCGADPARGLHARMAGVPQAAGGARRARDPGLARAAVDPRAAIWHPVHRSTVRCAFGSAGGTR